MNIQPTFKGQCEFYGIFRTFHAAYATVGAFVLVRHIGYLLFLIPTDHIRRAMGITRLTSFTGMIVDI